MGKVGAFPDGWFAPLTVFTGIVFTWPIDRTQGSSLVLDGCWMLIFLSKNQRRKMGCTLRVASLFNFIYLSAKGVVCYVVSCP